MRLFCYFMKFNCSALYSFFSPLNSHLSTVLTLHRLIIMHQIVLVFFLLNLLALCVHSQQNYSGISAQDCKKKDQTGKSLTYLYSCNGQYPSCQTFLILTSQPAYNSVATISNLTSSNPEELARINKVTRLTLFPLNKEVIVPVFCSCVNHYYQANTRIILGPNDTYFYVANHIYQGLSPCSSVMLANPYDEFNLPPNMELQVPLRCACPTSNQSANGIKYLVTFSIGQDDNVEDIGKRFNVSRRSVLDANGFSEEDPILSPSTAILIPLPTEPSSGQTIIRKSYNSTAINSPPTDTNPKWHKGKRKVYVIFAIEAVCVVLVLGVVLCVAILFYKKRSNNKSALRGNSKRAKRVSPDDLRVEIASFEKVLHVFGFEEIKKSTEDFSSKNRIKGCVYYGVFGRETLAVKKVSRDATKEVNILKKINHFNLIKLEGICTYQQHFYLVFEYMEKGSLRQWLDGNNNNNNSDSKETLSWARRIQIALDVAQGLNYLHSFTEPAYVHKNIKTSNILLNNNLRAKIANFSLAGAARKETRSCSLSTHMVGTRGYLASEYLEMGLATPKMDVHAFGVVVLELITGKNASIKQNGRKELLSAAVISIMEGDNAEAELGMLIDPVLKRENRIELAMRIAQLSVACLNREPERRPCMEEVVSSLLKIQADLLKSELVLDVNSFSSG